MPIPRRSYDRTLNAELERLLYQEKVILQEAEGLYWGLSDSQLNWRPPSGGWSIAQCLDHLNRINDKMAAGIAEAIQRGRSSNMLHDGPYTYGFLSRWFLRTLQPPVAKRFRAAKPFQPAPHRSMDELKPDWERTHAKMQDLLHSCQGLDLARIKVQSPAARLIKYPLGVAFWIQTVHDRRHLWQMRQVRNHASFPAS